MLNLRSSSPLALALVAVLVAAPRPADACGNGVQRVVDLTNKKIRAAEELLAEAKYQDAANEVLGSFPNALRLDHRDRKQNLFERGQRVLAVAVIRAQGALRLGKALPGKTAAERETNMAWATSTLRLHQAQNIGGVALTAELAEGLALRPAEATEAHALLRKLADDDLMPTPRAWAILGALEKARGDVAAATAAIQRCKDIATEASTCEVVTNS